MTLGAKVINLIRLHLLDDPNQIGAVCEVAVVKHQARSIFVRVLIEMIDPAGIEAARSPLDTMYLINPPAAAPPDSCRPGQLCPLLEQFWLRVLALD